MVSDASFAERIATFSIQNSERKTITLYLENRDYRKERIDHKELNGLNRSRLFFAICVLFAVDCFVKRLDGNEVLGLRSSPLSHSLCVMQPATRGHWQMPRRSRR